MNETPDIMPVYELKTVQFIDFYEVTRGLSEDFEEQVDNAIDRNHTWGDASLTLISLAFVVDNCKADGIDGKELDELEKRIGLLVDAGIKYAAVSKRESACLLTLALSMLLLKTTSDFTGDPTPKIKQL